MTSDVCSALVVGRLILVVGHVLENYDLKWYLRCAKTRNNERNTLLLRAFAICDNPLYYLKLIGLLGKSDLWSIRIK